MRADLQRRGPCGDQGPADRFARGGIDVHGLSGACEGTGACEVTVAQATAVTATFAIGRTFRIDTRMSSGRGKVTAPEGVDCADICGYTGPDGRTFTMTATPEAGSRFAGWSGGGCTGTGPSTLTLNANVDIAARFVATRTLTVIKAGSGSGDVTCGDTCVAVYDQGSDVTLTASPAAGSRFTGWSGGGCTGTAPCTVTLADSTAVTATFALAPEATPTSTPTPTPTATATTTPEPTFQPGPQPTHVPSKPAPNTRLVKKTVTQRTATFRFSATGITTGFRCALTARGKKVVYKPCTSPATFKRLKPGTWAFRVAAVGDPTPAATRVTVKKAR